MNIGFVFLALALGSAAVSAGAYNAPPANLHLGVQIVLYLGGALFALGFGFLAAISFLIGAVT